MPAACAFLRPSSAPKTVEIEKEIRETMKTDMGDWSSAPSPQMRTINCGNCGKTQNFEGIAGAIAAGWKHLWFCAACEAIHTREASEQAAADEPAPTWPALPSVPAAPLERLMWRVENLTTEALQETAEPLLNRVSVLAQLHQARALESIAGWCPALLVIITAIMLLVGFTEIWGR
jgi:hypothetical protein